MSTVNTIIFKFISEFNNQFKEYLIPPVLSNFPTEEHSRIIIENNCIILPAQRKYSDWDIYFYVNKEKIKIDILYEMRYFVISYNDFDLIKDYATNNSKHIEAKAYQSLREGKMLYVQFMGILKSTNFAPFVDLHIGNMDSSLLEEFYKNICDENDNGYLNWSLLSVLRKFKNTGEFKKDSTMFLRSILPALSEGDRKSIDNSFIDFMTSYFKDKDEFKDVLKFLIEE